MSVLLSKPAESKLDDEEICTALPNLIMFREEKDNCPLAGLNNRPHHLPNQMILTSDALYH